VPRSTGLVLGKFMPPHIGHKALIEFGSRCCDDLTVMVCSTSKEPIPGFMRFDWMETEFPNLRVLHNDDDLPQYPEECPDCFYKLWRESILKHLGRLPDSVFAGEDYGVPFAKSLDSKFVPFNRKDMPFTISGTSIRTNPYEHWDAILPSARSFYLRKVALVGPESAGKSTLAKKLAEQFQTIYVPEYGRTYTEVYGMDLTDADFEQIALGHRASEGALGALAKGIVFIDSECAVTKMWAELLLGHTPPLIDQYCEDASRYDLYVLLPPDLEWTQDGTRVQGDQAVRDWFYGGLKEILAGRSQVELYGSWDEKLANAVFACNGLLHQSL